MHITKIVPSLRSTLIGSAIGFGLLAHIQGPSFAAIIPPLDVRHGETALDVGFISLSVGHGFVEKWSIGAATVFLPFHYLAAGSVSYRMDSSLHWLDYGLSVSAGSANCCFGTRNPSFWFIEPAFNASIRPFGPFVVRATLGPTFRYIPAHTAMPFDVEVPDKVDVWPDPNVELAVRLFDFGEISLGLKSLVSYRHRWK